MQPPAVQVATTDGPGSGQFVAAALLDALRAGSQLSVRPAEAIPSRAAKALDLVLRRYLGDRIDVIRVGLDRHGRIVAAVLLSAPCESSLADGQPVSTDQLVEALGPGIAIAALRWHEESQPPGLEVIVRSESSVYVPIAPTVETSG